MIGLFELSRKYFKDVVLNSRINIDAPGVKLVTNNMYEINLIFQTWFYRLPLIF